MTLKPRPISGNLPFDAIKKYIGSYCGRIIGDAGSIIGRFIVNLLFATSTRNSPTNVEGYASDADVSDGQSTLTVPANLVSIVGGRLANRINDGADIASDVWDDSTATTSGSGWSLDIPSGVWTHSGAVSGEVRSANLGGYEDGFWEIVIDVISGDLGTLQLGGAPTNGFNRIFSPITGQTTIELAFENVASLDQLRIASAADGVQIKVTSVKQVPATWRTDVFNSLWRDSVALGDSITEAAAGYVTVLNRDVGHVTMANAGVAGNTLQQMDARFATDVAALNPDTMSLLGGINNVKVAVVDPIPSMKVAFESIIGKAEAASIDVLICAMTPFGSNADWTEQRQTWLEDFNAYLQGYAESNGYMFTDLYNTPLLDVDGVSMKGIYTVDGLHPQAAGYRVMADVLVPFMDHTTENISPTALQNEAADITTVSTPSFVKQDGDWAFKFTGTPAATAQALKALFSFDSDATNYTEIQLNAANITANSVLGGVSNGAAVGLYSHTVDVPFDTNVYYVAATKTLGIRSDDVSGDISAVLFGEDVLVSHPVITALLSTGNRNSLNQALCDFDNEGVPIFYGSKEIAGW